MRYPMSAPRLCRSWKNEYQRHAEQRLIVMPRIHRLNSDDLAAAGR